MTTRKPTHNQGTPHAPPFRHNEYPISASAPSRRTERRWLPAGLGVVWLYAYAVVWIATLLPAALVALVGQPLVLPVRHVLGLTLTAHRNPPPSIGHVLVSEGHNLPIVAWALLLGLIGAHRDARAKRVADGLLTACIIVNTLQVGAALGAYGAPLLPYVPQLPLEWGGLALGASAWLVQRRRALTVPEGLGLLALIAGVLLCAATLETVAVPHR
jgi:hypothetical protein